MFKHKVMDMAIIIIINQDMIIGMGILPTIQIITITGDTAITIGITITISNGAMDNKHSYRLYKSATMTITSKDYNMTEIVMECDKFKDQSGKQYLADGFAANMEGVTISADNVNATWKGDAKTASFTAAKKQVRIKKFTITLKETSAGITDINANSNDNTQPMYNLSGQRVDKTYKGVVIQNGKKFINR